MAHEYLFTVTMEHVSGITENRVVNTFPIAWTAAGSATAGDFDNAFLHLAHFYNSIQTTDALGEYISREIDRAADACIIRVYDLVGHLDGSAHGSPIDSGTFTLTAIGGTDPLPAECAVVLTTRASGWQSALVEVPDGADPGTLVDRPRQRLSGRVFIGPLQDIALATVSQVARVNSTMIVDLLDAGEDLQTDLQADDFSWMVWSRVNAAMEPITHLQVDDSFDTQRRRGPDPTSRTTRAL